MQLYTGPFSYKAVCETDEFTLQRRVMFFATAVDIAQWSGIPQKMIIGADGGAETVGFQRVENRSRVSEICRFYSERRNISNNPILCAVKSPDGKNVNFSAAEGGSRTQHGFLEIQIEDLASKSFADLFGLLRASLDSRITNNEDKNTPTEAEINELRITLFEDKIDQEEGEQSTFDLEAPIQENDEIPTIESHIVEFRKTIAIREILCREGAADGKSEFGGFTKERLISFLLPIVLVDGQHRLRGALEATHEFMQSEEMQEKQAATYEALKEKYDHTQLDAEFNKAKFELLREVSPVLPISLLLDATPAEQVFQFVVVNQKAVPVGKALLGTIVSTTLSEDELDTVRERLNNAGIPLENSRAITKLIVNPNSPFYNKVDRGLKKDTADLLQWNVLLGLIQVIRNLKGARLYHEVGGPDYANFWREAFLPQSKIVEDYSTHGFSTPLEYWSSENGPWTDFFSSFFKEIKLRLANESSEEAHNYWGKPVTSNIFNKISLNILLADFFEYLYSKEIKISAINDIPEIVESWLAGASEDYFSKNWNLTTKKDSTATRKKLSELWHYYRKMPSSMKRVPKSNQFN